MQTVHPRFRSTVLVGLSALFLLTTSSLCIHRTNAKVIQQQDAAEKAYREALQLTEPRTPEAFRAGLEKFKQAHQLFLAAGETNRASLMLLFIARTHYELGENRQSLDYCIQARKAFEESNDLRLEAHTSSLLGAVYLALGDKQKALESYQGALQLWRSTADREQEGLALHNIGLVYFQLGDKLQALDYFDKAVHFVNDQDDPAVKAQIYGDLGEVHADLGNNEIADGFLQVAISIHKRLGKLEEVARLERILEKARTGKKNQPLVALGVPTDQPHLFVQLGHSSFITAIRFSPNGRFILTGSHDGTARLWEAATGTEIRFFFGHSSALTEVAFANDGKHIVTASLDGTARLWDMETGREINRLSAPESAFRLSSDGRFALSCCDSGTGSLWEVATGKEIKRFEHPIIGPSTAFSPDNKFVVTGIGVRSDPAQPYKPAVIMWEVESGKPVWEFDGHSADIKAVAFSPDGKFVLTGSGSIAGKDNTARLLDASTGRELKRFDHEAPVLSVALSSTGLALTVGADHKAALRDISSGKLLYQFLGIGSVPYSAFSADGSIVSVASSEAATLYETATGKFTHTLAGYAFETVTSVVSPDGRYIATGNSYMLNEGGLPKNFGGAICLWDTLTGQEVNRLATDELGISALTYSDDGSLLASANGQYVTLWDVVGGHKIRQFTDEVSSLFGEITRVAISHDKKLVMGAIGGLVAGYDCRVIVWSAETGKEVARFPVTADVRSVAFSPDGGLALVGIGGHVIDGATGELVEQPQTVIVRNLGEAREVKRLPGNQAIFSPNGKFILTSGTDDKSVHLWDAATLSPLRDLPGRAESESLFFSGDSRYVLTGDTGGIAQLWEVASGKMIREIEIYVGAVKSVSLTSDNTYILTLGGDSIVRLWNVGTGKEACRLISFRDGTWVAVNSQGRFDTNNLEENRALHWMLPDEPFKPLPLELFMRDYYEPKLLPRLLKCTQDNNCAGEFKQVRDLTSLNRAQPNLKIVDIKRSRDDSTVTVTVEVVSVNSEHQRDKNTAPLQSGVYDVRLFRDGQIVGSTSQPSPTSLSGSERKSDEAELSEWRESNRVKLDATGKATITFPGIKLPHRTDANQVEFSAYAFNSDRVKSPTDRKTFELSPDVTPAKGRAYIISVGVNAYENSDFDLEFAADDARRLERTVTEKLTATGQYDKVVPISLLSDYEKVGDEKRATLRQATKNNFKTVLQLLSKQSATVDRRQLVGIANIDELGPATPDDLVLIMYSSHGYADRDGSFYFIPYDTGPGKGKFFTESVRQHSISSEELSWWLRDVDAGEMVMIVDACHSTAAVAGQEFKPGPMGSRGLGQLSYDKGMRILTATQADNVAWEYSTLKQGILTYALVRDGIEAQQADFKPKNGVIGLAEWLSYGVTRVPTLYEEVQTGKVQNFGLAPSEQPKLVIIAGATTRTASGKELEVVLIESNKTSVTTQQPSLFDFARKKKHELILTTISGR